MAFDLILFKKEDQDIEINEVVDYIKKQKHFKIVPNEGNYLFIYQNNHNKMFFVLNYIKIKNLNNKAYEFPGYQFSGFALSLNYIRPSFYAEEAIPIILDFVKNFNLFIYNPQSEHILSQFSKEELIKSWLESNRLTTMDFGSRDNLNVLAKKHSDYLYEYLKLTDELDDGEINIPKILIIKNQESNELKTAIYLNDTKSQIIPKVDYFIIEKEKKVLGIFKKSLTYLIEYDKYIKRLNDIGSIYNQELDIYLIENTDVLQIETDGLEPVDKIKIIAYDDYVDIEFD